MNGKGAGQTGEPVSLKLLEKGDQWLHASPQAARELARLDGPAPEPGQGLSSRTHSGDAGGNVPSNDEPECNQQPYIEKWAF